MFKAGNYMNVGLSIKDLENLSGIKAHTIRMWEKRYGILDPKRTETNIRYYDNDDLKRLLNITSMLDSGMRISRVSTLSSDELNQQILDLKAENIESERKIVINDLIVSTLKCDSFSFEKSFIKYRDGNGFEETIEDILYPLLVRIGLMWTASKLNPAQEHFASQLIKQKLFSAINELSIVDSKRKFLLYLPEKEDHEIGLLYAHYLIKKAGIQCIYLGPNVPLSSVIECSVNSKSTDILSTFTISRSEEKMKTYLNNLVEEISGIRVFIHGIKLTYDLSKYENQVKVLNSINDLRNIF